MPQTIAGITAATDVFDHSLYVVDQITADDLGILLNRPGLFEIRELSLITATIILIICMTYEWLFSARVDRFDEF